MEGVWRLIYADGTLDKFEDSIARQLATLLRLSHREAIACKLLVLGETRQRQVIDTRSCYGRTVGRMV